MRFLSVLALAALFGGCGSYSYDSRRGLSARGLQAGGPEGTITASADAEVQRARAHAIRRQSDAMSACIERGDCYPVPYGYGGYGSYFHPSLPSSALDVHFGRAARYGQAPTQYDRERMLRMQHDVNRHDQTLRRMREVELRRRQGGE